MRCALLIFAIGCLTQPVPGAEIIAPGAKVEKAADGFQFTEGPAPDAEGNVYFTDQPTDRILKYSVDGKLTTFLEKSGRSNGLYFDSAGHLWACADEKNELWKIDVKTKQVTVVVKDFKGKLLNGPNDLWITRRGDVYFTDPLYQRKYWKRGPQEQDQRGVYHVSPAGVLKRVDGDYKQPNGIIGSGDEKTLYVADAGGGKTYAYDVKEDGTLANRRLFCNSGSDGMTVDSEGNVYLTTDKVVVYNKAGNKIAEIAVPERPANVCFGGKDGKTLFITARKGFYKIPMQVSRASAR
jgi:gluconolactonase